FLKKRKGLIDGVAITGGEPTLQPALESFCFRVKNMGFKIKVDTNGSRPDVLENLFRRELVDFIAMDIKSDLEGYKYLVNGTKNYNQTKNNKNRISTTTEIVAKTFDFALILKSIKLIIEKSPAHEFRTTCVKPFITQAIMHKISKMIKGASSYVLQHCSRNVKMFNPIFFQNYDPFFSDSEFEQLKNIAESYGHNCSIR
ncbi:MAG: anaerobic ribonucleoside-triphosphate reductase activating protein, partial [Desulfamplus sp.]|nr:anaerobic ribonucleoside-triphosphate reductase activating protein [Desulfamplus sp.]